MAPHLDTVYKSVGVCICTLTHSCPCSYAYMEINWTHCTQTWTQTYCTRLCRGASQTVERWEDVCGACLCLVCICVCKRRLVCVALWLFVFVTLVCIVNEWSCLCVYWEGKSPWSRDGKTLKENRSCTTTTYHFNFTDRHLHCRYSVHWLNCNSHFQVLNYLLKNGPGSFSVFMSLTVLIVYTTHYAPESATSKFTTTAAIHSRI